MIKGLRPVLEGFVATMQEGACETGSQIPRALARGIWRTVRTREREREREIKFIGLFGNKPECMVTTNPDRSVLITFITCHFEFHAVNVSILHLKYEYRARSESRFACYPHCYVTWCPLMTGIVASQFPSSRDAALMTCFLRPFISACLNSWKRFLLKQNIFTKNLQT